jgi:hypothetical protein
MRILINGKPVDALTAKQERAVGLSKVVETAEGSVLSAEDATAAYIRQTKWLFVILGGIALVLMFGIAIGATVIDGLNQGDRQMIVSGAVVAAVILVTFLWLMLGYQTRRWNRTLHKRREGMPPPGTAIRVDAERLAVATQSFAWPSLTVEQVEISVGSSGADSDTVYTIERLSLASPNGPIVLDRAMLTNGYPIVDNIWRRLRIRESNAA